MSTPLVMEHLEVDAREGLTLGVVTTGDGAPLVLLHGFTGSHETWVPLLSAFARHHQVIMVDLPGHGASSAPADPSCYALPRFADDLAMVLDGFGLERAALVGYSLGARAALHFAVRYPHRLSSLVLESASPGIADEAERDARRRRDAELATSIERDGMTAFVDKWEALPLWESQRALPTELRARLRSQRLRGSAAGLANSLRGAGAGAAPALGAELERVTARTLLLAGALDAKYVALGQALARRIPESRLEIVSGAGHAVHLERPDLFSGLVLDWIGSR